LMTVYSERFGEQIERNSGELAAALSPTARQ
jgi:hypothetical protein